MKVDTVWNISCPSNDDGTNVTIWDICFAPDGNTFLVAAGPRLLICDTNDGSVLQSIKGHAVLSKMFLLRRCAFQVASITHNATM